MLYVAMTRAREKLILSVTMKGARAKLQKLGENAELPVPPRCAARRTELCGPDAARSSVQTRMRLSSAG